MKWVKQSIHYWCPDTKEHKFLGQNVTVAILDTGISPHPDFKGRILSFRDFSSTTGSSEKVLFSFSHFSPLIDNSGHGTHVAGIAGGGYFGTIATSESTTLDTNPYYGVAYDADLVMVGSTLEDTDILNGIKYVFNYADSIDKPAVVNISLNTSYGPHDGTSLFDQAIDTMLGKGKFWSAPSETMPKTKLMLRWNSTMQRLLY